MNQELKPGWATVWLSLFLACVCIVGVSRGDDRQPDRRRQRPDRMDRPPMAGDREGLSDEGRAGFEAVKTALEALLSDVNENRRPDAERLSQAGQALDDNKRYLRDYQDDEQAIYMLLQAWTSYYQDDDLPTAMNWALRAAKIDAASGDAWVSGALFCMLNDKKPILPRAAVPRRPRNREDMPGADHAPTANEPTIRKGVLDFDALSLRPELFSDRYQTVDYTQLAGEQYQETLTDKTLCVLLWQADPDEIEKVIDDVNDLSPDAAPDTHRAAMTAMAASSPAVPLESQQAYFANLAAACKGQPQIVFAQVNTDLPAVAEKLAAEAPAETAVPTVYAGLTDLDPGQYAGLAAGGPLMLVVNPDGKLRYAGPAIEFAPAFVLTAVTGVAIDLNAMGQSASPAKRSPEGNMPPMWEFDEMMMAPTKAQPPVQARPKAADPNQPAATDPNTPAPAPKPAAAKPAATPPAAPAPQPAGKKELSATDQYEAEKLLAEAQLHIEACRKIRGKSPEPGIIACRKVLADYPGTAYAEQARQWLRKVPFRYKEKYNITAEELGY